MQSPSCTTISLLITQFNHNNEDKKIIIADNRKKVWDGTKIQLTNLLFIGRFLGGRFHGYRRSRIDASHRKWRQ